MKAILAALLVVFAAAAGAATLTGRVVAITDGDTITLLDADRVQHKIRLSGIDAPEKANKKVPLDVGGQPFGELSKRHLSDLIFNKQVSIEWNKKDRYGRTVGKVIVDGVDANLEQIKAGMAWWYAKYRREQMPADQRLYSEAEQMVREGRVGLWRDIEPVAPWEWRRRRR